MRKLGIDWGRLGLYGSMAMALWSLPAHAHALSRMHIDNEQIAVERFRFIVLVSARMSEECQGQEAAFGPMPDADCLIYMAHVAASEATVRDMV